MSSRTSQSFCPPLQKHGQGMYVFEVEGLKRESSISGRVLVRTVGGALYALVVVARLELPGILSSARRHGKGTKCPSAGLVLLLC